MESIKGVFSSFFRKRTIRDIRNKATIAFLHDTFMAAFALFLSLFLRVGEDIRDYHSFYISKHVALYTLVSIGVYFWTQLYRSVWRYVSTRELVAVTRTVSIAILIYIPLAWLISQKQALPRSVPIICWFVSCVLLGGSRFAYRILHDWMRKRTVGRSVEDRQKILLIGVNDHADLFLRETLRNPQAPYEIVGLIDTHGSRIGRHIHGISVLGTIDDLASVVKDLTYKNQKPEILVMANPQPHQVRTLMAISESLELFLARLPNMANFSQLDGTEEVRLRPLALEDLLGRPQASLDRESMKELIADQKVLVTGAGGSIGGELVRQICAFNPARLILLDCSEYLLYTIDLEIQENYPNLSRLAVLADITDFKRVDDIIEAEKPDLVFHAAALKHVPIAESNPTEAILTNIIGTKHIAEACREHQVKSMVMISTDKAINPTNVMGASKRVAEQYCQALDIEGFACSHVTKVPRTRYTTVRFGNVLGSTGSVIPLFQRQLKRGGPITVTDPNMKRYFMTLHEAVELVLQSAALGMSENMQVGHIFVLDMGELVKISDLARQMIRLAGLRPDIDVKITYTGCRPGEKLYEELFYENEELQSTRIPSIRMGKPNAGNYRQLSKTLQELEIHVRAHNSPESLKILRQLVPEYTPDALQKVG